MKIHHHLQLVKTSALSAEYILSPLYGSVWDGNENDYLEVPWSFPSEEAVYEFLDAHWDVLQWEVGEFIITKTIEK